MIEWLLAALAAAPWSESLRVSRWAYAAVNTAHVLGIALLVGAIVPLDLRLLGVWRAIPHETMIRVLVPVACAGLVLALCTGVALFSIRASEYAGLAVLKAKLVLIVVGTAAALVGHLRHGPRLGAASRGQLFAHGAVSMACWIGALVLGRMIAFSE